MDEEVRRCGAPTRAGTPCRRRVRAGAERCSLHVAASPAAEPVAATVEAQTASAGSAAGPFADPAAEPVAATVETQTASAGSAAGPFADLFTPQERGILNALSDDARVDDVIPVLVVAIRRALAAKAAPGVVVRACEAFVRALRERQRLAEGGESEFERARNEALDRLSEELGIPL